MRAVLLAAMLALAGCASPGTAPFSAGAPVPAQAGNPVYAQLDSYKDWLSRDSSPAAALAADRARADNIVSWQMPHGGFFKRPDWYARRWVGQAPRAEWRGAGGVELGTIDNEATVNEILFLADVYARSGAPPYREAARRALDFLLGMQYPSGGFPQVYPARGTGYSNHVTFNDQAMVRVLVLFDHAEWGRKPLGGDLFADRQRARLAPALEQAVGYILKAQIVENGRPTVWCAQHDAVDYAPRAGRAFELPSKSGGESALVAAFLLTRPQTPAVRAAVDGALAWYRSPAVQLRDTRYDKFAPRATAGSPFIPARGHTTWYRFYELGTDRGFFALRTSDKVYDIMDLPPENRYSYSWGGNFGDALLAYAAKLGR